MTFLARHDEALAGLATLGLIAALVAAVIGIYG